MRLLIILGVAFSIVAAFADEPAAPVDEPPVWKTVIITLTETQAGAVSEAKGEDIEINLTREQINTIVSIAYARTGLPGHIELKTLTLNTAHLRAGNQVVVGYRPPDTADDQLEIQPEKAR
jgi:hypothetical protein